MHGDDARNVSNGNHMGFQVSPTHGLTNCQSVILIISPWGRHLMYTNGLRPGGVRTQWGLVFIMLMTVISCQDNAKLALNSVDMSIFHCRLS